jgi:hypothetical protein
MAENCGFLLALGRSSHGSRRMERQKRRDLNALALGVV